ncbi:MAG: D-2-hydroxyacid dehydrogenase [Rubrobacteraceae bacterium]
MKTENSGGMMVKIVVASYFEEENVERIREVDGDFEVSYRAGLVQPPRWEGDVVGEADWRRTDAQNEEFLGLLSDAEILLDFPRGLPKPLLEAAPNVRWIQGGMAGAGPVAKNAGLLETDVVVTTASGVFSNPLAEFVLGGMLSHAKDFERLRKRKESKTWSEEETGTLEGKTLCIIGTGGIGRAISERAKPFGMKVVGVKRTVRKDDEARKYTDELYPTEDLHDALEKSDYVAVTLPHTEGTENLVDAAAMDAMKPGAYFANVGRGAVVDEDALVERLESGHISGAALDVFREEPLPEGSPLWSLENVIISPHSTDNVPRLMEEKLVELFCENLRRYLEGRSLVNVLDKNLLY